MSESVSVLIVDDDAIVRNWVRSLLEGTEFYVAGEAASAAQARSLVPRRLPDLLLVDYRLPDARGTDVVRELRAQHDRMRALIMTANREPGLNESARSAGADGCVLKTGRADEIVEALRAVASHRTVFDERHPRRPPGRAPLSPREREVVRLVAEGLTNRQIAAELQVRPETVKTVLLRVFGKLGVSRRAEAVSVAKREGLL
jgi:DNA-binding NarL/FixJ family response regulator